MPTWGLDRDARATAPWGLPGHLLEPAKTQTDPIHRDIYWTELEKRLIDSKPMQRLRHVKQLGMTLKVYPSAEHSRFTHLLGTVAAAQQILDKVAASADGPHSVPNLLEEWVSAGLFSVKWAEATVLARLAALLHDLTHVPFGHTIEDDLEVLTPHDRNVDRFADLWAQFPSDVRAEIEAATTQCPQTGRETKLFNELRAIVLDKAVDKDAPRSAYPFVADVVNNTICADLLDYIARDHLFLGLPFAVGDRFMDNFFVVPSYTKSAHAEQLVVRLVRDGETRIDVRTELLKYLRYRYEETERALYHKTKLAYDAMLGKMLEMWKDSLWYHRAISEMPEAARDSRSMDATWLREQVDRASALGATAVTSAQLDGLVQDEVERHFRFFGDEGLIEHLVWHYTEAAQTDERESGILELAERIRHRDHYRLLGQASGANVLGVAKEKFDAFGKAATRRALERNAARFAGISPAWQVVLWIPSPSMRLKIAEVLVQQEDGLIRPLARAVPSDQDHATGDQDAALIVQRHMQLWSLRVYVPPELRLQEPKKCDHLLGYLSRELGLPLVRWDGVPVESCERQVANELGDERGWTRAKRREVEKTLIDRAARGVSTYDELYRLVDEGE
jgi:HD superfamily phosphohydrolase